MQYMLIFNETPEEFAKRNSPTESGEYWGAWTAFIGAINAAGVVVGGNALLGPDQAARVQIRDGKRIVQDGPFADAKEMLGGYLVIEVPDLDTALLWAARAPSAAVASVEVRPVMPPMRPANP